MIISYTANTPGEAWRYVLKQFPDYGVIVKDTKTIDGVIVTEIKNPTDNVEKNPVYGQAFIDEYKKQFLTPINKGFEYTYGQRLIEYPDGKDKWSLSINQLEYIIKMLRADKNTRRAQAITWNPFVDTAVVDVPCLQIVKCRIVKGKMHMEVVFRSHDMLLGYYPNVLGLSYLMDYLVNEIGGVTKGHLTVVSLSPHVYYNRDRDTFKAVTGLRI